MIKTFTIILCVLGMLVQTVFIYSEYRKNMFAAVWLKGLASVIFVCVGAYGLKSTGSSGFSGTVVTGLVLGAIGDVLLNIRYLFRKYKQTFFIAGTVSFFLGHVMYLIALIPHSRHLIAMIAAGAFVSAGLMLFTYRRIRVASRFKVPGALYILTVVFMATVAMGNLIEVRNTSRVLFAIGALFFLTSDMILINNTFSPKRKFSLSAVTLVLYYIGQILIALSVYFLP